MGKESKVVAVTGTGVRAIMERAKATAWKPRIMPDGWHQFPAGTFTNAETGEFSDAMLFWPQPARGLEEGTLYCKVTALFNANGDIYYTWSVLEAGGSMGGHSWEWASSYVSDLEDWQDAEGHWHMGAKSQAMRAYLHRSCTLVGIETGWDELSEGEIALDEFIQQHGAPSASMLKMFGNEWHNRMGEEVKPGKTVEPAAGSPWKDENGESY